MKTSLRFGISALLLSLLLNSCSTKVDCPAYGYKKDLKKEAHG